jgi:2',5'-phosphodiesterase
MRFPAAAVRSLAHRSRFAAAAAAVASFGTVIGGVTMLESARTPLPLARVVSYNVLSSHLCGADHYIKCKPEDLDPPTRRKRVEALLSEHMDKQAVICLQEVSVQWVGELTPFFERAGYTFVTGNYGNAFNGYMGVALAWPTSRFTCEEMSISKLADTKPWPEGPKKEKPVENKWSIAKKALGGAWASIRTLWAKPAKRPFDVWHETKRRHNFLASAKLRCKQSGASFAVSTYHMPCLFGSDEKVQVMTNHAALAAQEALRFAGQGTPCVLAGDFNIKPGDAPYALITKGMLPATDPHMPPAAPHGDRWTPSLPKAMGSAYVMANGVEPEFTNLATNAWGGDTFCETLDYIFLSSGDGWKVHGVRPLPSKEAVVAKGGCVSYPIATEPSDHTMIWADLSTD